MKKDTFSVAVKSRCAVGITRPNFYIILCMADLTCSRRVYS